jgi:hypothetical protein
VDGAQQAAVIKILVAIIKTNTVILCLDSDDDSTQHLYYADLVTIRNSECSAIYGNILESTIVCAGPGTDSVKNACYVSL